jgi:hypothetical protein
LVEAGNFLVLFGGEGREPGGVMKRDEQISR